MSAERASSGVLSAYTIFHLRIVEF